MNKTLHVVLLSGSLLQAVGCAAAPTEERDDLSSDSALESTPDTLGRRSLADYAAIVGIVAKGAPAKTIYDAMTTAGIKPNRHQEMLAGLPEGDATGTIGVTCVPPPTGQGDSYDCRVRAFAKAADQKTKPDGSITLQVSGKLAAAIAQTFPTETSGIRCSSDSTGKTCTLPVIQGSVNRLSALVSAGDMTTAEAEEYLERSVAAAHR